VSVASVGRISWPFRPRASEIKCRATAWIVLAEPRDLINFWKMSKIAQRRDSGGSILDFITAPYRHLSVTESVALSPDLRRSIMPSLQLKLVNDQARYTNSQLLQLRRQMLRYARSWPRGSSERNQRRQTAASLRSLLGNKEWLDAHTVFLIREYHRDQGHRL
jgi:hypothetical protein